MSEGTDICVSYVDTDGNVRDEEMTNACLRMLGKDYDYLSDLKAVLSNYDQPLTITYYNMLDRRDLWESYDKDLVIATIDKLRSLHKAFKCCLSTTEEIVNTQDAVFDVQNFSYNEVLWTMFQFRSFMNGYHCDTRKSSMFGGDNESPMAVMCYLQAEQGMTWKQASVLMLSGTFYNGYTYYHTNGDDSCCYYFSETSVSRMNAWLSGELFDDNLMLKSDTMKEHLDEEMPYPKNMVDMLTDGDRGMEGFYLELQRVWKRAVPSNQARQTLFDTDSDDSSVSKADRCQAVYKHIKENW